MHGNDEVGTTCEWVIRSRVPRAEYRRTFTVENRSLFTSNLLLIVVNERHLSFAFLLIRTTTLSLEIRYGKYRDI